MIRVKIWTAPTVAGYNYERVMSVRTASHDKALSVGITIARRWWRKLGSPVTADGRMYTVTILE
jgi:hypothetical protein